MLKEVGSMKELEKQGAYGNWLCMKFNVQLHPCSCSYEVDCNDRIIHDINSHSDMGGWGGSWYISRTYKCPKTCIYIKSEAVEREGG